MNATEQQAFLVHGDKEQPKMASTNLVFLL